MLGVLTVLARAANAQTETALAGQLLDQAGHGIPDASVSVVGTLWEVRSDPTGHFLLTLPAGLWELTVRCVGYESLTQAVTISDSAMPAPLELTLSRTTTELRSITVTGVRRVPMSSTVTRQTVRNVPALGEADIFRLLPFLGSVSQPNDLIGRLYLAGGASDEYAVSLDGHPLQAPFHVLSVLGAFNVASLDMADILIYHVPSKIHGRASGAIDLTSRQATDQPVREGDISLLSATAMATQPSLFKGVRMLASGRVTYLDRVVGAYARSSGSSDDVAVPAYRDGIVTLDRAWKNGWSGQLLWYGTSDFWHGHRGPRDIPPQWGESLLGTHVSFDGASWHFGLHLSTDNATVLFRERNNAYVGGVVQPYDDMIHNQQRWTSGDLELERLSRLWHVEAGLTLDIRHHAYRWRGNQVQDWFSEHLPLNYEANAAQSMRGGFLEASLLGTKPWTATLGVHLTSLGGRPYLAPRFVSSLQLSQAWRVEFAADRRFQFDAIAEEPKEGSITQPTFLLQRPRRADILSVAANWHPWYAAEHPVKVDGTLTMYARHDRDRTILPPETPVVRTPQPIDPPVGAAEFPQFDRVPGRTVGASATAKLQIHDRTTVQGTYTWQRVRERVDGSWRATAWDIPQTLSLFAGVSVSRHWMLTGAAQFRTGTAFTPVVGRLFVPIGSGQYEERLFYGDVNSARLTPYQRFDIGARYGWTALRADWTINLQVINILNHTNLLDSYGLARFSCPVGQMCSGVGGSRHGLPILPTIGLQVRW